MIYFALLSLISLLFPLTIAAHGPMNNLASSISPPPAAHPPLLCPVLDYAVKVNYDASLNSLSIYFLSLNSTFNTVFTDVHLQSPFESNIRMGRTNNQSIEAFESLEGTVAEATDITKTGTGELFPRGGRSITDRQSAYSAAQLLGSVLQLFNATIPNVKLSSESTVRVWFTYCLNNGLIDCNTEIFVWRPSSIPSPPTESADRSIPFQTPRPFTPPPTSNFPLTCPALNFTHKLIKETSTTAPGGYAYKIVFINLDSPEIMAELVDVHYKISSPARSVGAQDWINIRMKQVTPHRPLADIEQYSWTTGSIIDISRTGTGALQTPPNLLHRQEKELMVRKNNVPLQMFEVGNISLNLGDQLNFWFTYCLNMVIDCNTEEYLFRIPTSLSKKEQLFQTSSPPQAQLFQTASPQAPLRSPVAQNININTQDFNLINRPQQQTIPHEHLIRAAPMTNVIRSAPVLIPSIRTLPIATVPNNPNLNNNFNLHRSTSISAANANAATTASIPASSSVAADSIDANQLMHQNVHSEADPLSSSAAASVAQPHIRTVYNYEIDPAYGDGSHYYYNPHTIRYYVMHDEL